MRKRLALLVAVLACIACSVWLALGTVAGTPSGRSVGLFTSLPILWAEAADMKGLVDAPDQPHWARDVLTRRGTLVPLDTLLDLSRIDELVIAQPRPFAPEENVALDNWVRNGGRALLFADPMLTHESAFALGDRRRPQDVVLISPILSRWGVQLRYDEGQPVGPRESAGERLPINLAGTFSAGPASAEASCSIAPDGLVARCKVGKGRATLIADAALLESGDEDGRRKAALTRLLNEAFGD